MKLNIRNTAVILAFFLSIVQVCQAAGDNYDIRFRTVFYFYPGSEDINLSQVKNSFSSFEFVDQLPEVSLKPVASLSVIKDVKNAYPVPGLDYLAYFGRGVDKQQATQIQASSLALVIDVAYPLESSLSSLKKVTQSVFSYADSVGALIWDSETRELFTAAAWQSKRLNAWRGLVPNIDEQTVIHAYQHNEGIRAITLGMAKFGLPDIVVNNFSWSQNRSMGNLINFIGQSLIEGVVPNANDMLELNISELRETRFKKELVAGLKENAVSNISIQIGDGKWEEGDPENYIIEVLFNNIEGTSLSEQQDTLLSSLFGWEDEVSYVKHNKLIEAASQQAKSKLNQLRADFNNGLNPGEFIGLKAPFTTPDGGVEWMWVEVQSWEGTKIKGLLKNEPLYIPSLKGGSEVEINQNDIFDYIRHYPDGTSEGNETGALIKQFQVN